VVEALKGMYVSVVSVLGHRPVPHIVLVTGSSDQDFSLVGVIDEPESQTGVQLRFSDRFGSVQNRDDIAQLA
jgi:hypothetical protein